MSLDHALLRAGSLAARAIALGVTILLTACNQTTSLLSHVGTASGTELVDTMRDGAVPNEKYPVAPIVAGEVDAQYLRQRAHYAAAHPPGTIVVDPDAKFLYLVLEDGMALRYGIGVGREGFGWSGAADVARKAAWPTWTPPATMIRRQPELARYRDGMAGGPGNPLGARALYLYQNGRDTLYRIHGTSEPWSIGRNVSSGCIRLLNQDAIDMFERVPVGARVVVLPHGARSAARG